MKNIRSLALTVLILLTLFSSVTIASLPPWTELPRLDRQLFQVIKGEDARVNALTVTETVDMIPGPGTTSRINRVLAWGGNMSWATNAAYAFIALQCRDVWPPEAAGGPEGKTPGQTCSPMNYSGFRVALSYIFGMMQRSASIYHYVQGAQVYSIKSIIPPAQVAWYDSTTTLPETTDYAGAWAWMQTDGFYIDENILYDRNGIPCRDLTLYYSTGATAWQMELPDFVATFNDFMDNYLGVTNCNMMLKSKDFTTLVYGDLMLYHDFDMVALGLTDLGPDCDWVVSMFSSDYDVLYGWNFVGVHDPYIDHLMNTILRSMDPNEIKVAVYDFQHYFNGEIIPTAQAWFDTHPNAVPGKGFFPHFLWSSSMAISSYEPHVMNYIDMPCWGSEQCAEQWAFVEYEPGYTPAVSGAIRRALSDEPTSINPFSENTLFGWLLMDGPEEGLLTRNPQTLEFQPWLAKDYYFEGPINDTTPTGKTITNGMKITYYIREGIYWQDSGAYNDTNSNGHWDPEEPRYEYPFTAYDCKFAADLFLRFTPGHYDTVWDDMVEVSTEGPYKFTVWYSFLSYWYAQYPSVFSMFPQHIYQKAVKQVDYGLLEMFSDFKPAFTKYQDWTGLHPPDEWGDAPAASPLGGWSALVGTGPFIFGYYNPSTMLGETVKNTRYWAGQSSTLQSIETGAEHYDTSCFKKELVDPVITLENATSFNRATPVRSYWYETMPALGKNWHIDGWKDTNHDGLLSVGDELTLSKDLAENGQWVGQGEFAVESTTDNWIITVKQIQYTPKLTSTAIIVDLRSMVWKRGGDVQHWTLNIDVKYELFCDGIKIAEGMIVNVAPFEGRHVCVSITNWNNIEFCKHAFRADFYVRTTGSVQDPEYVANVTGIFAYLPGDVNGDGTINMIDIYTYGIKNFLATEISYAWNHWHNDLGNGPGSLPPAKYADVNCDGIINLIDIYRMIIMYMKTFD